MGMTIAEKILAAHCGRERVKPGELLMAKLDLVFGNELGTGFAIHGRERLLEKGVFDRDRIAIIPDHFTPNRDVTAAEQCKTVREFVRRHGIKHYFEVGRMGIEHIILPEKGLIAAGELVAGADSHTCTGGALGALCVGVGSTDFLCAILLGEIWLRVPETIRIEYRGKMPRWLTGKDLILHTLGLLGTDGARYKVLEFAGGAIDALSMDSRFSMCNMAAEAGAKTAIIAPDSVSLDYQATRAKQTVVPYYSDADAEYAGRMEVNVAGLEPQIACPCSPANVKPLSEATRGGRIPVDQVFIGSCTNGRIEDLRMAAEILSRRESHPRVRLIVIPGSQEVYAQAMDEGLVQTLVRAGAAVSTPTCGPCIGGHMGLLASGERCVATSNRNFKGRMGHYDSEVYLSGVPVAAATAILGHIASPEEI